MVEIWQVEVGKHFGGFHYNIAPPATVCLYMHTTFWPLASIAKHGHVCHRVTHIPGFTLVSDTISVVSDDVLSGTKWGLNLSILTSNTGDPVNIPSRFPKHSHVFQLIVSFWLLKFLIAGHSSLFISCFHGWSCCSISRVLSLNPKQYRIPWEQWLSESTTDAWWLSHKPRTQCKCLA